MSGPVVLLALLSCFQIASALTRCDYELDLKTPFLADKENLYCFDDEGVDHVVDEDSVLCSDVGIQSPRTDGMDVRCGAGFTLVGYSFYPCDTQTGVLATSLSSDETLSQYSACVAEADVAANVCSGVDVAAEASKLKLDQDVGKVSNVDLVPENTTDYVSYAMACDDGLDFQFEVSKPVYGYCSGNAEGNAFTLAESDGCYEMCSAAKTNLEGVTLAMEEGSRNGATVSSEVVCPSGFEIAFGAAEEYAFVCNGVKEGSPNEGIYDCGEGCPECLAQCPANPTSEQITNFADVENLASVSLAVPAASGETVMAGVACGEGFSLAFGAEEQYDLQCSSNENDTEANSGQWTIVNDFPVCHPVCPASNVLEIENVQSVIISSDAIEGESGTGIVNCKSGYGLSAEIDPTFDFTCTAGQFVAAGDGPQCLKECSIPEAEVNATFVYYLDDDLLEGGRAVAPGRSHVEVRCSNESLKLVGSTSMSCNREGELIHDDENAPYCADTIICSAPVVVNGQVHTRNNLEVGGVYTISCNPSHWFDTKTVIEYNAGDLSEAGYSESEVKCEGDILKDFTCYFGCLAPDFAGGATFPDMAEEGSAPYQMGAVVDFKCLDDAGLDGAAQATCEVGGIGAPVCGACSFALSLVLSFALLLTLL